jgi:parallel beta-helix repeat protein
MNETIETTNFLKAGITIVIALSLMIPHFTGNVLGTNPLNNPPDPPTWSNPSDGSTNVKVYLQYLQFKTTDPDGDDLMYNVYFEGSFVDTVGPFQSGKNAYYKYDPALMLEYNTTYHWNVTVIDVHGAATDGPEWSFTTEIQQPPSTPSNPHPSDTAIDVAIDVGTLQWTSADPNIWDDILCHLYFGDSSPPSKIAEIGPKKQGTFIYDELERLEYNATYYWNVTSIDSVGNQAVGPIWSFTTMENQPPAIPSNPDPLDGATQVGLQPTLCWTSGDNKYDMVTYEVYFGESDPPTKVADVGPLPGNVTQICYTTDPLVNDTIYYWKVIAEDNLGASSEGPVWNFTTARTITIYVDDDFTDDPPNHKWDTIQEGIADALDYDTVYIYNGNYAGTVTVDKSVNLVGESKTGVIVDGTVSWMGLAIIAEDVSIDSLTAKNATWDGIRLDASSVTINNCHIEDNTRGIQFMMNAEHDITITDCTFYNNSNHIQCSGTEGAVITSCDFLQGNNEMSFSGTDCVFDGCDFHGNNGVTPIVMSGPHTLTNCEFYDNTDASGVRITSDCSITDCLFYNNGIAGLDLGIENTVTGCEFFDNEIGIFITGGENIITDCMFTGNTQCGIRIPGLTSEPGMGGNMIYYNQFLNSAGGAMNAQVDETDPARNTWDDDIGIGNYWDDHPGGNHSFGIWETEYRVGLRNKDRYPLVNYPYEDDVTPPELTVLVPEEGAVHLRGKKLFSLPFLSFAVVIGDIIYEANASDESDIARVEFTYTTAGIPDHIDYEPPYTWELNRTRVEKLPLYIHAVDTWEHYTNMTIETFVINLGIL